MSEIKLCGLALCGVMLCAVFKSSKNEYSLFVRIGISVLVSLLSFTLFLPILSFVDEITKNTAIYEYIPTLIKAFGIAVAVQLTADICKDAGEESIANKITLFGKAEILILTMPLIKGLFELCHQLLK